MSVRECACVREREKIRERHGVCVCVREKETEIKKEEEIIVCEGGCVGRCMCEKERERMRSCEKELEKL